jgi:hypothetical protein
MQHISSFLNMVMEMSILSFCSSVVCCSEVSKHVTAIGFVLILRFLRFQNFRYSGFWLMVLKGPHFKEFQTLAASEVPWKKWQSDEGTRGHTDHGYHYGVAPQFTNVQIISSGSNVFLSSPAVQPIQGATKLKVKGEGKIVPALN